MTQGKQCKLRLSLHQKNYSAEDVLINVKDVPDVKEGDIIEVYDPELDGTTSRLLLQIPHGGETAKDSISIDQSIATAFKLRSYHDVIVAKIDPAIVAIELLELTFKDQYFGRSDMWRLKKSLVGKVMYINKKIEFLKGSMRCQVYEMWTQGEKVTCGVVDEDTKVVFRSYTCQCYLFLQMSEEMWEPDLYGDLYFEKAVNGFLKELFARWAQKENGSNHDVTIVLFSRTYYNASSIDEFPNEMRHCLQKDYQGRFYEDFYRVAIQNERITDWAPILTHLRTLFHYYKKYVLTYHCNLGVPIPEAYNSNAAQGNFLETLNISLNVFEKHNLDRSFDRTGQMSVVITPGVGIFEVDRELTNITNQRIIDNGVGSDLVCMGEQPLHAVPLLKFHKRKGSSTDDYSMPNTWINLSFYRSNKRSAYGNFVPCMKNPIKEPLEENPTIVVPCVKDWIEAGNLLNTVYDHETYDAQVFKLPPSQNSRNNHTLQSVPTRKKTTSQCGPVMPSSRSNFPRKLSDSDLYRSAESISGSMSELALTSSLGPIAKSPAINIPPKFQEYKCSKSLGGLNWEGPRLLRSSGPEESPSVFIKTSSGANSPSDIGLTSPRRAPIIQRRSLINPFDPSHMTIKVTSYRRRWIHTFPKGPSGALIQQHYYQSTPANVSDDEEGVYNGDQSDLGDSSSDISRPATPRNSKQATLLWGATGEQEWNAGIKTDVDWKSLTLPACFPLTTDYFPDQQSLSNAYVVASNYSLLPEELGSEGKEKVNHLAEKLMNELVSQRLGQGCQLIIDYDHQLKAKNEKGSLVISNKNSNSGMVSDYKLSIGRVFHRLAWKDPDICITVYRPRHPYPQLKRKYKYRFRSPYLNSYELSYAEFKTDSLESYMWNYLDNLVALKEEYNLREFLKYWRVRLMILPDSHKHVVKKLNDAPLGTHCDIYHKIGLDEQRAAVEGFVQFMEMIHRIKRPVNNRKNRSHCGMRDRLGSNRMDKSRPRPATKDRVRFEGSKEELSNKDADEDIKDEGDLKRLTKDSSLQEIIGAMRDTIHGVPLISQQPGLSPNTFIASDATYWVLRRFDDIVSEEMAIDLLRELLVKNLIRHASQQRHMYFVHGFYLYYFVTGNTDVDCASCPSYDSDWHEVKVDPLEPKKTRISTSAISGLPPCPVFLLNELPRAELGFSSTVCVSRVPDQFRSGSIDIDIGERSDRKEWGELKYHKTFSPLEGYEMVLKWLVASGNLVCDLISMWQRKAMNFGLHVFPMPSDPFALPLSYNSDPLRSPIVIPLNVDSLRDKRSCLFEEYEASTRPRRLWIFMKYILEQFGFMPFRTEIDEENMQNQFVHVTGNMFVLIASDDTAIHTQSPRKINQSIAEFPSVEEPKFLWTFNYMLSKRWKSSLSSDESLGERIMVDFEEFCSNKKGRLRDYWDSLVFPIDKPPVGPYYPTGIQSS